jgi:hypothetical protein
MNLGINNHRNLEKNADIFPYDNKAAAELARERMMDFLGGYL